MLDSGRLRQVLVNPIGDAVKFTEPGEVVVQVRAEPEATGRTLLHFSARDTGIGVPLEKQTMIFDAFSVMGRKAPILSRRRTSSSLTSNAILRGGTVNIVTLDVRAPRETMEDFVREAILDDDARWRTISSEVLARSEREASLEGR